ncbi:MAG: 3-deoxy-D-manno-octulosonic acid transferase [Deltaproteobacteria bacterium]|nr:3-deoxy-D-manno-octulosonic acid transferase [Deltaproteobacteria bacterium]
MKDPNRGSCCIDAMVYFVHRLNLTLLLILSLPFLPILFLLGRRYREGFFQRIGFYPLATRDALRGQRPVWIHAVSVGEALAAEGLVRRLKEEFPDRKILLSTFSPTGNAIAREKLSGVDAIIFLPLDHPWIVSRVLRLFDPSLIIFLETEIWPNLLRAAHRRGIPTLLLSGRISKRAFRRYRLFHFFFSEVVRQFTAIGMQTEEDAQRIIQMGAYPPKVWITGNLKHAALGNGNAIQKGFEGWGLEIAEEQERRVLVAGSTHRGEEDILIEVFLSLKPHFPDLLMVLAPRHSDRFPEVERLLQRKGIRYVKKSQMNGRERGLPVRGTQTGLADVIFLDTLGDLLSFYSMADIAFVGGSLVDAGGHNLMEPARFRKPVLFGPHMTNFTDIAAEMKREGGGIEVKGREDLIREISGLLTDPARAKRIGELAYGLVEGDRGVVDRSMGLISRYL